jgi:membrane protein YdbS with pleckstrin-like domain
MTTSLSAALDRNPRVVSSVMLPYERQVVAVRQHPAVIAAPSLAAAGGLLAAAVLSFLSLSGDALAIIWSAWGLVFVYWLSCLARWPVSYFIVTNQRLLIVRGLLRRDVWTVPLSRATQLGLRRSFFGRLLGYGQFILDGAEARQAIRTVNFMPYPELLYLEITSLIFRDPAAYDSAGGDQDDDNPGDGDPGGDDPGDGNPDDG